MGAATDVDALRNEYFRLLESGVDEQAYQEFLEQNTQLLPHDFMQNHGLHFSIVLRKLKFGADYACDFFYLSKSSDDWNCVFVELEKPSSKFFRKGTNDFHRDFIKGLEQIGKWRAWLSVPENKAGFLSQIDPLLRPHVMACNPFNMKYVLVTGRREEYGGSELRRRLVAQQERDDIKIITFDSLAEDLRHKHECYIGVRNNEFIDILGDTLIEPDLFGWLEPSQFRVSKALQTKLEAGCIGYHITRLDGPGPMDALKYCAERIRVR